MGWRQNCQRGREELHKDERQDRSNRIKVVEEEDKYEYRAQEEQKKNEGEEQMKEKKQSLREKGNMQKAMDQ